MTEPLILVLDEGTTSVRAMLFSQNGELRGVAQQELTQHYPQSGWVEQDAGEIWESTLQCGRAMVDKAGGAGRIAAIGVANQRETVVAWDRESGEPLCRAIVWQDRRTAPQCATLREAGHEKAVQEKTGLLLDPYFSATKMRWMLDHDEQVQRAEKDGRLAFGTVESWLVFKLTGHELHVSDSGNASRTLLLPLADRDWDEDLCELFGVPRAALPRVVANCGRLGETDPTLFGARVPICGLAGDQQAATIGQGCLRPGEAKATFGTGAFILANSGTRVPRSEHRLITTVLLEADGQRHYALEGSIFVAGSLLNWLRDSLRLITRLDEAEDMARAVPDSGGLVVVPALSGLGAPHWLPHARGIIGGVSFSTRREHIVRAALEAMAHQTHDLAEAFAADGAPWTGLRIDGGMASNDWVAQDIADLIDLPVTRPDLVETTALGAAMLAAVGSGLHADLTAAADAMIGGGRTFTPQMDSATRRARLGAWREIIAKV